MTEIMQYNENNYRDYEQYRGFAVIRFYATWCAPCLQNYAVFEQLTTMFGQHIKFGKLNVDQAPILTLRYNVYGLPSTLIFQDGVVIQRMAGVKTLAEYMQIFKQLGL